MGKIVPEFHALKDRKVGLSKSSLFVIAATLIASRAEAQIHNAAASDLVELAGIDNIVNVKRLPDGSLELTLENGDVVNIPAGDVVAANGQIFVSEAVLESAGVLDVGYVFGGITVTQAAIAGAALLGTAGIVAAVTSGDGDNDDAPPPSVENIAPVFTSNDAFEFTENGDGIVSTASATDADGDALTYSIAGGADAALFEINADTGELSFVDSPDFEAPDDSNGDNVFDVIIGVSDGSDTTEQTIAVTVTNANDNAPVFLSDPTSSMLENTVETGFTASADDLDGDSVTFSIVGGADAALFAIDAATGVLVFLTAPDFEAPADADGDNSFELIVEASDGNNTTTQAVTIQVADENDNAPSFTSPTSITAAENQTETGLTLAATDADGDAVQFSITDGADAAQFAIDADTGGLSFLTAPDFETPSDADGDNSFELTITASDGENTTTQSVTVQLTNENDNAPVFTSDAAATTLENTVETGFTAAADDLDGDSVTFSIAGGADAALFGIDAATGALSFLTAPDFEAPADADGDNNFELTITASDGLNSTDQFITIDVSDVFEVVAEAPAPGIESVTPSSSEGSVSVGRVITVTFTEPIDAATITADTFNVTIAGQPVEGVLSVSPDGLQASFIPDTTLPGSSRGTITVDGTQILTLDGTPIDADGDNSEGGTLSTTFDTINLNSIEGTTLSGVIFDSNRTDADGNNIPIEGVRVSVDGRPDIFTFTDASGAYTLEDVPAPAIFVIFDTSDAIAPDGFAYGGVIERFETTIGQSTGTVSSEGEPFDIFLPLLADGDSVDFVQGEAMSFGLGEGGLEFLADILPDADPASFELLSLDIPTGASLSDDDGNAAQTLTVAVLDTERLPGPLPEFIEDAPFAFTIDAGDATNFLGEAVTVTIPNTEGFAAGETRALWVLNEDTGVWEIESQLTVSDDGSVLVGETSSLFSWHTIASNGPGAGGPSGGLVNTSTSQFNSCLLYTSDAADE